MTNLTYPCEGCGTTVVRPIGDEGRKRFCSVKCGRAHQPMKTREERYRAKVIVSEDDCWGWTGTTSKFGYGLLYTNGRQEFAHRVSWSIQHGPVPTGLNVLHHCDNPPCSRPDHLFVGDDRANMLDRDMKGRHGTAKLKPADIRSIRARRQTGERLRTIAGDFGIVESQVSDIARRLAWKHVE